jgi:hypothetical protein
MEWDIFDVLNLLATLTIAGAASAIAWNANALSRNANTLTEESMRLEADKQLLDWARRVLAVFSALHSLRQRKDTRIDADTFDEQRRDLRSQLFALKDEGALYFPDQEGNARIPALAAIGETIEMLHGVTFKPPKRGDYDKVRYPQVKELQRLSGAFLDDIKPRIDKHWIEQQPA